MSSGYRLGNIDLPNDLLWADEYSWSATASKQSTAINGALIHEFSRRRAGRPITLQSGDDFGWGDRTLFDQLMALVESPNQDAMILVVPDGREFSVRFRGTGGGSPVTAEPIIHIVPSMSTDRLQLTIRLIQV